MENLQKCLIAALLSTSAAGWIVSRVFQPGMMSAMASPFDPLSLSVFVAVWSAGMAAMMFPAISPVVLLYSRLARGGGGGTDAVVQAQGGALYRVRIIVFIGSYLTVWAVAGLALLLAWSAVFGTVIRSTDTTSLALVQGSILLVAGGYQFSGLKSRCLGYCESPMSLFIRRWRQGTSGAIIMGTFHGTYCLGCCWPYFLIMVALGWMDILWMGLFAGIILAEKLWPRGIWIARGVGIVLLLVGALVSVGFVDSSTSKGSMMPGDSTQTPETIESGGDTMPDMSEQK
jgi:predicted metal-binding membrane protein